jgi:hypothetical protein
MPLSTSVTRGANSRIDDEHLPLNLAVELDDLEQLQRRCVVDAEVAAGAADVPFAAGSGSAPPPKPERAGVLGGSASAAAPTDAAPSAPSAPSGAGRTSPP